MNFKTLESHTFAVQTDCRYLLHVPQEESSSKQLIFIALHGYSSNPEAMLRLTAGMVGSHHVVASIQAPNQHYVSDGLPDSQSVPGYNWGIRNHWESVVRLHHDMVLQVAADLKKRFHVGPDRCVLTGFSQPVGLNYRFAATHPNEVRGVIGICGGVPRDWEDAKYEPVTASLLHIARDEDPYYPVEAVSGFSERLRKHASDVEFHLIPGPHRFPSSSYKIVRPWLARVFG